MQIEQRYVEIRGPDEGSRIIEGCAVPYGATANIGQMKERFTQGAAKPAPDCILNLHHDQSRPLARSPQTLEFEQRDTGLHFKATIPKTREGDDALENIRAGILTSASVEFICKTDRVVCGTREVMEASIEGIGLVTRPAYEGAKIQARGKDSRSKLHWWWI